MFEGYQSALDKAKRFLFEQGDATPQEMEAIKRAKQMGLGEDSYVPAIASQRMKQKDQELASSYQEYKSSPSTYMSSLKAKYGKEDRGIIGDTIGLVQNLFADIGENVEEAGSAIMSPIETTKGLASLVGAFTPYGNIPGTKIAKQSSAIRSGLMQQIKDNFGSVEKAKETFYENPFDVLSILIPATKALTASKAAKGAKVASVAGKAGEVSKGMSLIDKMKDIVNWDNALVNKTQEAVSKGKELAGTGMGELVYGNKGGPTLEKVFKGTEDPARIAAQEKFGAMTPSDIAELPSTMQKSIKSEAGKAIDKSLIASANEGTKAVPEGLQAMKMEDGTNIFKGKKFLPGDEDDFIKIADTTGKTAPETVQAQQVINEAFSNSGLKKDKWLEGLGPKKAQKFKEQLEMAISGQGPIKLSDASARIVSRFSQYFTNIQEKVYPKIKVARDEFREASQHVDDFVKEVGRSTAKDSTIYNNMAKFLQENSLSKETIDFIAKKTGVNLEDVAIALKSKEILGRSGKSQLAGVILGGAGAALLAGNPLYAVAGLGYTALTSPRLLYAIAKFSGPKRAAIRNAIAKASGASAETVEKMLNNIGKAKDSKAFEGLGKNLKKPSNVALLERILDSTENAGEMADIETEREDLQGTIGELEKMSATPPAPSPSEPAQTQTKKLKYQGEPFNL